MKHLLPITVLLALLLAGCRQEEPDTTGLTKMTLITYNATIAENGKFEIVGDVPVDMVERFYDEDGKIGKSIVYDYADDHGKRKLVRKRVNYRNENGIIYKYEVYSPSDELICESDVDLTGYTLTIHYCGNIFYSNIEVDKYDENWLLIEETDSTEDGSEWDKYIYKRDKQGRVIEEISESSYGYKSIYTYRYAGKKAYYTVKMDGSNEVTNGVVTYDKYGNDILREEKTENSEMKLSHDYTYNSRGLPIRCNYHYLWESKLDDTRYEDAQIEYYTYE